MANEVLLEVEDGVATITINRPEVRNAITDGMARQMARWLEEMRDRDDVRVVVLRGAGDKAFSAGHDLKENAQDFSLGNRLTAPRLSTRLMETLVTYPRPTIAAVRGYVRQGGVWLCSSCDIIIASDDATFALTGIARGQFPAMPVVLLMRRMGRSRAVYMVLAGEVIDAHEAKAIGLIDRLVPVGRFEEEVRELAKKLASREPQAVRAGKEALGILIDADTVKALKVGQYASALRALEPTGEQIEERYGQFIASVRGTGNIRKSY
ncbi:MAG: enoyl-CoA hydratase/isomerase family protein [Chloroflexi bacterium]|nr:enoyl-CoA hydratase/isomerase family protein [Chloroflexota bacterium]